MKFFLILLIPCISFGQLEVIDSKTVTIGEIKGGGSLIASLTLSKSIYCLSFRNQEYKNITDYKTICFKNEDSTLDKLYTILKNATDEQIVFKLGQTTVATKKFGGSGVIISADSGYITLTDKQIDKLFGKKD